MKYCRRCILPDTRPGLRIGSNGICSACLAHEEKEAEVDWENRRREFDALVTEAKQLKRGYDCIIPVSGGKDSTWQVIQCLRLGLRPLAVSWKPPARTEIGAANLVNLIRLGVDHIDYQVNPNVEKKFLYEALTRYGTPAIPMHMAMFGIPLTLACKFSIPLVIWGENPADEYVGKGSEGRGWRFDSRWIQRFGVTHGTTARDWVSPKLTVEELTPYFGPTDQELERSGVRALFLGYYFKWDPFETFEVARQNGFQARPEGPKTGYYDFADIDDDFISIHHHLKWFKFGFTRTFDNLSLEIRNHRMTRQDAVHILRERGDETPHEDIEKFCSFTGITLSRFRETSEKFRNPDIWVKKNGAWMIEDFLLPDWAWS